MWVAHAAHSGEGAGGMDANLKGSSQRQRGGRPGPFPQDLKPQLPASSSRFLSPAVRRGLCTELDAPDAAVPGAVRAVLGAEGWLCCVSQRPPALPGIRPLRGVALHAIQCLLESNTSGLFSKFSSVCFEKESFISCVMGIFCFDGSKIHFKSFK